MITFDMARRLPFRLRPGPLQAAIARGVHFEICYSAALRDETARRNFFSNSTGAPSRPTFCERLLFRAVPMISKDDQKEGQFSASHG